MKTVQTFFGTIMVLLMMSCSQHHDITSPDWKNPHTPYKSIGSFRKIAEKKFVLDSLTSLAYPIIQYVEKENLLVAFTTYDNSFVLFDYNTGKTIKKIHLDGDSRKGIGRISTSFTYNFHFLNYDSIYLFNADNGKIFLVDSTATIKHSYSVRPQQKSDYQPHSNFGELMAIDNGIIYLDASPGMNINKPERPLKNNIVAAFDPATGKMTYAVKYPDLYTAAYWGEHFNAYFSACNAEKGVFVRSFPMDHYIYEYDRMGNVSRHYAGSKHIDSVAPFLFTNGNVRLKDVPEEQEFDNYVAQNVYYRMYYDKYRKIYYRFISSKVVDWKKGISGPFSIVVLDKNLRILREQEFDSEKYRQVSMFVSREGLCLWRKDSDDDNVNYDLYQFSTDSTIASIK
jgi:Domain of unknown function (DUF4221)